MNGGETRSRAAISGCWIRERAIRGMRQRAVSGKIVASKVLYGYQWGDIEHTRFDTDPVTGPIVQRIFRLSASGVSIRRIGQTLTDDGIPTPSGRLVPWDVSSVRYILRHPNYTGSAFAWCWRTAEGDASRSFDDANAIQLPDGTIPALVTPDEWNAVQERLQRNKQEATRNNRNPHDFLLRAGFARCGHCGYVMTAKSSGATGRYLCNGISGRRDTCDGQPSIFCASPGRVRLGACESDPHELGPHRARAGAHAGTRPV